MMPHAPEPDALDFLAGGGGDEFSDYALELLRKDEEFILYRGRARDVEAASVLPAPASTHPAAETLKKIEHEYSLGSELDRDGQRGLGRSRHNEQTPEFSPSKWGEE